MSKRKNTVTKHDIIRAVKELDKRLLFLDNMISSLGEMLRGYIKFMDNEDEYIKFMEKEDED